MQCVWVACLLLLCGLRAACAEPVEAVSVPAGLDVSIPLQALQFAIDDEANWSLDVARRAAFQPVQKQRLGFMNHGEVVWVRLTLQNAHSETLNAIFDTGDFAPDRVDLFVIDAATQEVKRDAAGSALPLDQRAIQSRFIAFPLVLSAQQRVEIYLRVHTRTRVQIAPTVFSPVGFQQQEHRYDMTAYAWYGGLIALILYHLVVLFFSREWGSAYFIALMLAWGGYSAMLEGLLFTLLPSEWSALYQSRYWSAAVVFPVLAMVVMTISYLKPQRVHPALSGLLIGIGIVTAASSVMALLQWLPFQSIRILHMLCLLGLVAANCFVCGLLIIKGYSAARFYFIGSVMMLIFLSRTIYLFLATHGLYTNFDIWMRLAYLAPMLLFAVGHGQRLNELKLAHVENARRAAQALEQAEFKSNFLAKMSHEVRTPMNGVLAPAELLRGTELTAEQKKYVDIISTSGTALLDVVNDILDFSKLEAGKLELAHAPFAPRELVSDCAVVFSVHPKLATVKFDVNIAADVPLMVKGDAHRLRQVLTNLIGNAFKFTHAGSIRVEVNCPARVSDSVRLIEFAVIDSGIGIPPEDAAELFTEYRQLGTSKTGGTGLGLAICKQIVELMQGTIEVASKPGVGSTFKFRIPLPVVALTL